MQNHLKKMQNDHKEGQHFVIKFFLLLLFNQFKIQFNSIQFKEIQVIIQAKEGQQYLTFMSRKTIQCLAFVLDD